MNTVKRVGYTLKAIESSGYKVTAIIGHYELKMLDGASVSFGDKKVTFKMWNGKRLYVNVYRKGKKVFSAYFEAGIWERAWYLRSEEFLTQGDAQEFANILKTAMPKLVTR